MEMLKRFVRDERGLETVEYAVILALIVVATIVAIKALSTAVQGKFNETADTVTNG